MQIPELIDIIDSRLLSAYREQIEKDDRCIIMTDPDKDKDLLCAQLNDEQKKLLNRFANSLIMKYDYINFQLNSFILNVGIKYGMGIQKAFDEE